ncbi:MAG: hypothetical protein ONB05_00735 [candidate division KSB1 bacterium]|nr:hypothetical protein [candidate division KSB1 bacterium]
MLPSPYRQMILSLLAVIFYHTLALAQLAYSPFTDASVAYTALTGAEVNFARGNPATLAFMRSSTRISWTLENNQDQIDSPIQCFAVQLAITSRLTLGVGHWQRTATTGAVASRSVRDDPFWQHPLRWLGFGYRQRWCAGLGLRISRQVAFGISMHTEEYSASPTDHPELATSQQYQTFDFGLSHSGGRLNWGIIFRNFLWERTTEYSALQVSRTLDDGSVFTWNPTAFTSIAFEPKRVVEAGVHWVTNSRLQVLADFSSRREYAIGLRGRVLPGFLLTAGRGKRYDRIYDAFAVHYRALGAQFHQGRLALAVTWIIPIRSAQNRIVTTDYGDFDLMQMTNHQLLMGMAFFL